MKYIVHNHKTANGNVVTSAHLVDIQAVTKAEVFAAAASAAEAAGKPGITKESCEAAWDAVTGALCGFVAEGKAVNMDIFYVRPGVKGTAKESISDVSGQFHPCVNVSAGASLRHAISHVPLELAADRNTGPRLTNVYDKATKKSNLCLTPGQPVGFKGVKIEVEGTHPTVGVYFQHVDTKETIHLSVADCIVNTPGSVIVIAPASLNGRYNIFIVTQYLTAKKMRRDPITIAYPNVLPTGLPPETGDEEATA